MATTAGTLAANECFVWGQVASSLTRTVVARNRHDKFVDALTQSFAQVQVGDPFDPKTQMGPLASRRQRDRVEGYVAKGLAEGAVLAAGGGVSPEAPGPWLVRGADV